MTYTLLIWEVVPEDTKLYLIPNEEVEKDGRVELLRMAHNQFINQAPYNMGLAFLNAALCPIKNIDDDTMFNDNPIIDKVNDIRTKKEWRCIFDQYKVPTKENLLIENCNITRVVLSGFIL